MSEIGQEFKGAYNRLVDAIKSAAKPKKELVSGECSGKVVDHGAVIEIKNTSKFKFEGNKVSKKKEFGVRVRPKTKKRRR